MEVHFSPETQARLQQVATRTGKDPAEVVEEAVQRMLQYETSFLDAVEQGRIFSEAVTVDGVILTKLDADAKGGSAISMATIIGKPIFFATVGQNYEDLISFNPDQMVSKIVG